MECGIERTLLDLEHVGGNLTNALRDSIAVDGAECDDFEDEQIEGALQQVSFFERSHRVFLLDNLPI